MGLPAPSLTVVLREQPAGLQVELLLADLLLEPQLQVGPVPAGTARRGLKELNGEGFGVRGRTHCFTFSPSASLRLFLAASSSLTMAAMALPQRPPASGGGGGA